jgi:hypothetical protein
MVNHFLDMFKILYICTLKLKLDSNKFKKEFFWIVF